MQIGARLNRKPHRKSAAVVYHVGDLRPLVVGIMTQHQMANTSRHIGTELLSTRASMTRTKHAYDALLNFLETAPLSLKALRIMDCIPLETRGRKSSQTSFQKVWARNT